jgi:Protein  of unknown function (DUF3018)
MISISSLSIRNVIRQFLVTNRLHGRRSADGPSPRYAGPLPVARHPVTRYNATGWIRGGFEVTVPAERMKTMRDRRRAQGLRELRLVLPDARSSSVKQRVAIEVARLGTTCEDEALSWIETVSEFDALDDSETQ